MSVTNKHSPLFDFQLRLSQPRCLLENKNVNVYYWLCHTRTPLTNRKHFIPNTRRNFHLLIKLIISNQVELNPGPRTPRWPCGVCAKAVTWKSKALECDTCKSWFHIDCQGNMTDSMYAIMDSSNISWHLLNCGLPNFASSYFNSSTPTLLSNNSFSVLSCDSPGIPNAQSSPKPVNVNKSHNNTQSYHTKNKKIKHPLKVISLNFQSIKNKKPQLDILIDTVKPDIIIGTETWLDPTIQSSEFFPSSLYTVFRKDRPPNNKGQSYGGVLIAVSTEYESSEVKELDADCEIVWVEVTIQNSRKLLLSSFYRPQPNDKTSLYHLNSSLSRLNKKL